MINDEIQKNKKSLETLTKYSHKWNTYFQASKSSLVVRDQISSIGNASLYRVLFVERKWDGIFKSQDKYILS